MDSATQYKLIILYMLSKVDFPLTNEQISSFFLDRNYTTYFSFQESINSLIDSGFISKNTVRNKSYYHLTAEGEQTIGYFKNKITNAIIDDVDLYLIDNKYQLRSEAGTLSDYYGNQRGEYIVHSQIKEGDSILIELNLTVPTKEIASLMCSNWKDASQKIYDTVVNELMKNNENNNN